MVEENYDIIYKRLIRRFIISAVILLSVFILKQLIVTEIASKTDDVLHQSMENQKSAEKLDEMVGFFQL